MAIREASKKWTKPIPKWKDALNHFFAILFEDCRPKHLKALKEHEQAVISRGEKPRDLLLWKLHFQDVIETRKRRAEMTEGQFASKVAQLRSREPSQSPPPNNEEARFRNRLAKQKDRLLGCMEQPAAEPTNNIAERDLRPASDLLQALLRQQIRNWQGRLENPALTRRHRDQTRP